MIQNQIPSSRRSKKWDRQGTVLATGENDQYLVRVGGSGRLTLRNRRFLRKFQEQTRSRTITESVEGLPAIAMPTIAGEEEASFSAPTPSQSATPAIDRSSSEVSVQKPSHPELGVSLGTPHEPQRIWSNIQDSSTVQGGGNAIAPMQATDHALATPQKPGARSHGFTRKKLRNQQLIRNLGARAVVQEDEAANREDHAESRLGEGTTVVDIAPSTPCLRRSERVKTTPKLYDASTGR